MENFALLFQGFSVALLPQNILAALAGAFMGIVVGAMPGIGSLAGCSLLLPLTFHMNPTTGTVSYTHLDVYKRQVLDRSGWDAVQWYRLDCYGG